MANWYKNTFRKLFFDFHSSQSVRGLASAFDAERWADRLAEAGAQGISVFVKCGFGWSYYRKGTLRHVHPELPPGLDMVESQINALRHRGIRAIGYYHLYNSEQLAKEFPDWRRNETGDPDSGIGLCLHGPYFEKWVLPHVEEIVGNYALDGLFFDGVIPSPTVCRCPGCRQRFEKETGNPLPSGTDDDRWPEYVRWTLDDYERIRRRIAETIHRINPEMVVSFNWAWAMRVPETPPAYADALMTDVGPDDQVFNASYQARQWAPTGKPFDIMNTAFLRWWGDWGCKPATAMQHEAATIIANGGCTWIGYQWNHTADVSEAVMGEMAKTLEFVRQREPFLIDAKPWAAVAVLHSSHAHFSHGAKVWVDETGMRGVHRVLLENSLPHHFVAEEFLISQIRGRVPSERYPVIVLSDQRRVNNGLTEALGQYVREGGVLLVTGETGTLDENYREDGRFSLGELLGVKLIGRGEQSHCYFEVIDASLRSDALAAPHLVEDPGILVQPLHADVQSPVELWNIYLRADGKPLLTSSPPGSSTGHPAVTVRRVGRGIAAYVAADIFRAYQLRNDWSLKNILGNLIRRLAGSLPVRLAAPAWLEMAVADQKTLEGTRTIVHLINHHGQRPAQKNNVVIEQSLPVHDVVVSVRRNVRPRKVSLEPGAICPRWHFDGECVIVEVPAVEIHLAVVME